MQRTILVALGAALASAGVALAVPSRTDTFTPGTYAAGKQSSGPGIRLLIRTSRFDVKRISYRETCSNGSKSFSDEFTFVSGSEASITGPVQANGVFSGRFHSNAGTVTVSGRVQGTTAAVKGTEESFYAPGSTAKRYVCRGSRTFSATRLSG